LYFGLLTGSHLAVKLVEHPAELTHRLGPAAAGLRLRQRLESLILTRESRHDRGSSRVPRIDERDALTVDGELHEEVQLLDRVVTNPIRVVAGRDQELKGFGDSTVG
jgi:hypothetical protein